MPPSSASRMRGLGQVTHRPPSKMVPGTPPPLPATIEAFAREHLDPRTWFPKNFRFVDALPRTASLKINRPDSRTILGLISDAAGTACDTHEVFNPGSWN